jgi:hypothetical protein
LKIISGDDPRTVAAVAREVGVDTDGGFDARQLPEDPQELAEVMEHHTVFGRVTPAQKKDMVRALQRRGHVVAMTGDGVNDALALMPNTRRYRPGFLKRSLSFAVPAGLIIALAVLTINAYSLLADTVTGDAARTCSVHVLTLIALWVLVVLSRPLNRWRLVIISAMYAALALVLTAPPLREFFDFTGLGQEHLTASLLVALSGCLAVELLLRAHRRHLNPGPPPPFRDQQMPGSRST